MLAGFWNTNMLWMPLGPTGALGTVAAKHAVEGCRVDLEIATKPNMVGAQQSVQLQRQNHKHATPTDALWTLSGLDGVLGELAQKPAVEGRKPDQDTAIW